MLELPFPFFTQAVGSQKSQTQGLAQGVVQLGCNAKLQTSWKHYGAKEMNIFEKMTVVRVGKL